MPLYLQWLTLGVALAILELVVPGTYLIWFGFASLVVSGAVFFMPELSVMWQLIIMGSCSILFALLGWKIYGKLIFKANVPAEYKNLNDPIARLLGKTVQVSEVKNGRIQVSVGDTVWSARCDETVQVGDTVTITGSHQNVELQVRKNSV